MPSTRTIVSAAASTTAIFMVIRSIARDYLPREVQSYFALKLRDFISSFSNELTFVIDEYDDGLNQNRLFKAAKIYLEPKIPPNVKRIKINLPKKETNTSLSVEKNEEIVDVFNGVHLKRKLSYRVKAHAACFELSFHKKNKDFVLRNYIPHVLKKSKEISQKKKTSKLLTLGSHRGVWQSVNLDHPATFDTLAMDFDMKKTIMDDLERFLQRKEFYRRVGKAWKRGYLLYGPPGTGKMELVEFFRRRGYLISNGRSLPYAHGRSLPYAHGVDYGMVDSDDEDAECGFDFSNWSVEKNRNTVISLSDWCDDNGNMEVVDVNLDGNYGYVITLSGLLNFIDGLWSSCGDERIIIFTTNHKDRLDPALLRPGRMDMHIHMSYCTPRGFKMLASNYLGITEHPLFVEIEKLIETAKVTPADVAEQLLRNEAPELALSGLTEFLETKKRANDDGEAKETEDWARQKLLERFKM
ncbi:protein HYPER-SENSITIVITY-RELATED 4 [Citrus sinensis]|uniref:AAA+ ATPase domain-containing protein n=1 Tax=Citrus clementina TaxID=85681 RepID=V4SHR3_CITCL|nr:hypothetical protein CICLE_v10030371mg [Citrus x clementina]KAH9656802.1 protein HYPER-SENSITIVITY-RELATED 4 [Citrus sinensis]